MDISVDRIAPRPSEAAAITVQTSAMILGEIAWLMMESAWHRGRRVADFARLVMPPIKLRQFRLFHDGDIPIAFVSWARLSPDAECRYLDDPQSLALDDWNSGDAVYLADVVVSRHAMRKIAPHLRRDPLLSAAPVRGLKNRNGKRILVEIFADAAGRYVKASRLDR
jgi:hemolysin-activating ACP:hemolysin acyltransferase